MATTSEAPETTEEQYMKVINYKTAKMFEASSQSGAALAGASERDEMALAQYGACLGIAFQLIDDVLDYIGSAEEMGKNVGDDLAEGKPTLPLIHAIRNGPTECASMIRSAIKTGGLEHLDACRGFRGRAPDRPLRRGGHHFEVRGLSSLALVARSDVGAK